MNQPPSPLADALRAALGSPEAPVRITGALVLNGTGAPGTIRDVVVRRGRILDPAAAADPAAEEIVVDASGLALTPGFVDIHTHSDLTLLSDPVGHSKLLQGVTTEIVGNCGLGMAPLGAIPLPALRGVNSYLDRDPAVVADFPRLTDYLDAVAEVHPALNVGAFVAHIPLHAAVTGLADVPSTPEQVARIADLARAAIADGAVGISTGLVYAPLCFVDESELVALGEVAAETDSLFAWHVRDYIDELEDSVEQAIRIAERTGCRTQISHLQSVGRRNWASMARVLARIDEARARGLDVWVDMYPYLAGNAPLSQLLPGWVQSGGNAAMIERLRDFASRSLARAQMVAPPGSATTDEEIMIAACPDPAIARRTVADVAGSTGQEGIDVILDVLAAHGTAVQMVTHGRSREVLEEVLHHEACVVASDGSAMDPEGPTGREATHPRSYGCFPRYLSEHWEDPADAVRRCTSAPAARVRIPDRGTIVPGAVADLVLLDPDTLEDRATYLEPHRYPAGISAVIVGGTPAAIEGTPTGARTGQVLRSRG